MKVAGRWFQAGGTLVVLATVLGYGIAVLMFLEIPEYAKSLLQSPLALFLALITVIREDILICVLIVLLFAGLGYLWSVLAKVRLAGGYAPVQEERFSTRSYRGLSLGNLALIFLGTLCLLAAIITPILFWVLQPEGYKKAAQIFSLMFTLTSVLWYFVKHKDQFPRAVDRITFFGLPILPPTALEFLLPE